MDFKDVFIYSVITGIMWGITYFFIRRLLNPHLNLLNSNFLIKKDPETYKKINDFYYDAIFGGIAVAISYFIMRNIRFYFKLKL